MIYLSNTKLITFNNAFAFDFTGENRWNHLGSLSVQSVLLGSTGLDPRL